MKVFNKYEGNKYTFKLGTKNKLINKIANTQNIILKKLGNTDDLIKIINKLTQEYKKTEKLNLILVENISKRLNLDETKVYNYITLKYFFN